MTVIKLVDRALTKEEKLTIEKGEYYTGGKAAFACMGKGVTVELQCSACADIETLKEHTARGINEMLSQPPDFSAYVMDDGYAMVFMAGGVAAMSLKKLDDAVIESGKVPMSTALSLRKRCIDACARGEVIAIACRRDAEGE